MGLNPDNEIMEFEDTSDFDIFGIFGYMSEEKLSSSTNGNTDSEQSEIIIYGSGDDILHFFYLKKYTHKKAKRDENFGDYLSCKIYKNDHFICAFNSITHFSICIYDCQNSCNEVICKDNLIQEIYNAFLYDTSESYVKVLFAQLPDNKFIFGNIIINLDNNAIRLENLFNLPDDYNTNNCNTKNCDFILFNNEYLLCCSCNKYIICTRFDLYFNTLIDFKLNSEGANSYIKIMDNINYLSIFFLQR